MIPHDYSSWRRCIEVDCGLELSASFIAARLTELREPAHERTAQFIRLYGKDHWRHVVGWFEQAADAR
jgi:hypothetical protein